MFEVTLLFLVMLLIAACAFFPLGCSTLFSSKSPQQSDTVSDYSGSGSALRVPEDSTVKQNFLTHLQSEIESALFPRPTDSILQRHYDALVNAELENRLAAMPDS
ncbi:MAG: hypothetical protein QX199_15640 [Methylococcaceae bacterium]